MKKLIFLACFFALPLMSYGHELTVIYTGNSYASLYPCGHCPVTVGGGITRRAAVVKEIKSRAKNVLIVDAGNFTAGGDFDENSINFQMDEKRSAYYYEAMKAIGYDAVGIGEAEFNFGEDFLKNNLEKHKLNAVSANLKIAGVLPYYIKNFPGFKVGIIGLSPKNISKKTAVNVEDYDAALNKAVSQVKNKVDLIILVSALGDNANYVIAEKFPDIKLIITSGNMLKSEPQEKIKNTTILRPSYLAKELRFADLEVKTNEITKFNLQKQKLELAAKEEPEILKIIPRCFRDNDCAKKEGLTASCQNAGSADAACSYVEPKLVEALVITDAECPFCSTTAAQQLLKKLFAGINFTAVNYKDTAGQEAIKKYGIISLPAFILPAEIKNEKAFPQVAKFTEEKDGKIILKPEIAGLFLFLNRKEIPQKIDFFINLQAPSIMEAFNALAEFCKKEGVRLDIYFLIDKNNPVGYPQEEMEIALNIRSLAPDKFLEYLKRRLNDIRSASWVDSAEALGLDTKKIKDAAKSKVTAKMIEENNKLILELNVTHGNVMLVNNNRIFQVFQIKTEDLKKLFKK